jgi:hypothetical protein
MVTAEWLRQRNYDRAAEDAWNRAGSQYGRGFGGGAAQLIGGFLDPINWLTMRIAPAGIRNTGAKGAAALGATSRMGRVVGGGVSEGIAGTIMMEPFVAASNIELQRGYDMEDFATALALDVTLGTALNVGGETLGRLLNPHGKLVVDAEVDPWLDKNGMVALMKAKVSRLIDDNFTADRVAKTFEVLEAEAGFRGKLNTAYLTNRFLIGKEAVAAAMHRTANKLGMKLSAKLNKDGTPKLDTEGLTPREAKAQERDFQSALNTEYIASLSGSISEM